MITEKFVGYGIVSTDELYRWDVNQVLQITNTGLTLPPVIHFTNKNPHLTDDAITVQATISSDTVKANIPNKLLTEPYDIIAYLYTVANNEGKTLEMIRIPVIDRAKPSDYQYSENITVQTAGKLEAEIISYYNKAISQLEQVNSNLIASDKAEAEARAKADQTLQSQINAIVIGASADNNVAAEVAQARVDSNGKSYPTLKERLDILGIFVGEDGNIYQNE
jgi:hypothetical protein